MTERIYIIQQSPKTAIIDLVKTRPRYKWVWASLQYAVPTIVQYATRDKDKAIAGCRRLNMRYDDYVVYYNTLEIL